MWNSRCLRLGSFVAYILLLQGVSANLAKDQPATTMKFPPGFLFGAATAAYQIEGAWDADGKSPNIWDHLIHNNASFVQDLTNGDEACDSYHLYKRDVQMLRELGVDFYRFSISWARILPTGMTNNVNKAGINYYNNLINELIKYNITPMVTMYHWDLPQKLQDLGGWSNAHIVQYYSDYARILFTNYADRVKRWLTFNEPMQVCLEGYGRRQRAPALGRHGVAEYLCTHNLLKSHASAYHMFDSEFRPIHGGKIGIAFDSNWAEPLTNATSDHDAVELYLQTTLGWYAHPIYSKEGGYPPVLVKKVGDASMKQNYKRSRLPEFSPIEIEYIKGTADFFGINHYTTYLLTMAGDREVGPIPSHENDIGIIRTQDPNWPSKSASKWLKVYPSGFRKLLNWIHNAYPKVPILVTENGYSDFDGVDDYGRESYYKHYLNALLETLHKDRVDVIGYTAWSLMDNFEWEEGFTSRFGMYLVDFKSPNKTRTPKRSSRMYAKVIQTRQLPSDYDPNDFSAFSSAPTIAGSQFATLSLLALWCLMYLR